MHLFRYYSDYEYKPVVVLASCTVAGYRFVIGRNPREQGRYVAVYAPLGLSAATSDTIESTIAALEQHADVIPRGIAQSRHHMPDLTPEDGLEDWRAREMWRFDTGEYRPIPSTLTFPANHFAHLSVTEQESDYVAYTPSDDYGERDRQVRLRYSKYLRKVFPEMSDTDLQAELMAMRAKLALSDSPSELLFATDRATITGIFETAMCACDSSYISCMHGKFEGRNRPYHVYADSPDVAIAYLLERGEITARSVVSTRHNRWIRLYAVNGCSTACGKLRAMLANAGYDHGSLDGSRLTKLDTDRVMLPYLDGDATYVSQSRDDQYWIVSDDDGEYIADQTDGSATENTPKCERCENDQDDCSCIYCDCCGSYLDGCEECRMCDDCDRCFEHGLCRCPRCSECNDLIDDCLCERCGECDELENDCTCEETEETEETEEAQENENPTIHA